MREDGTGPAVDFGTLWDDSARVVGVRLAQSDWERVLAALSIASDAAVGNASRHEYYRIIQAVCPQARFPQPWPARAYRRASDALGAWCYRLGMRLGRPA